MIKLSLTENICRWIDIYTFQHYPEEVREGAYSLVFKNNPTSGFPFFVAATFIYLTCQQLNTPFDYKHMDRICTAHRTDKTPFPGLKIQRIRKEASKWKL